MRFKWYAVTTWIVGLALLSLTCLNSAHAQDGENKDRPRITRDTADQLALIGTLERGAVRALAWSSDGSYLAVAASNGITIYDTTNWDTPPQSLPSFGNAPANVVWRPGTYELITVHDTGEIRRWALVDGVFEQVSDLTLDMANVLLTLARDRRHGFDPLAFTADGTIYVALDMHEGWWDVKFPCDYEICIRDVSHQTNMTTDPTNQHTAVLPDGTVLVLNRDVAVSVNGLVTAEIPEPDPAADFPPPTSYVIIRDDTGLETGRIESGFIIPGYESYSAPDQIALSPDGALLAAGGCTWVDETFLYCQQSGIKLFDVASGRLILEPKERFIHRISALTFSSDGTRLAAADGRVVWIWDVTSGEAQTRLTGYGLPGQLVWHPTQPALISASGLGTNIWSIDSLSTGTPIASLPGTSPIAVSPDGQWLVTGNRGIYWLGEITHPTLWDISNPAAPYAMTALTDLTRTQQVDDVTFSPDGAYVVATTENNIQTGTAIHRHRELRIFETQTFSLVASTRDGFPVQPSFSPDGRWFMYGVTSPIVTLLVYPAARLADGDALFSEGPYLTFEQSGFVFPPQSDHALLFVEPTREVQIWDLDAKQQVGLDEKRPFWAGTYTTDGSLIVIGDTIYDTTDYKELWDSGMDGGHAVFSSDERYLFLATGERPNVMYINHDAVIQVYAVPQSPDEVYEPLLSPYSIRCGSYAEVYVLEDDTLNVRDTASLEGEVLTTLELGTRVELVEGPYSECIGYDGRYVWLNIRTPEGMEGWAVMFADGIQTLISVD